MEKISEQINIIEQALKGTRDSNGKLNPENVKCIKDAFQELNELDLKNISFQEQGRLYRAIRELKNDKHLASISKVAEGLVKNLDLLNQILPDEVLLKIFGELDVKDLKSLSSVSKNISRVAQDPFLIKSKFPEKYNKQLSEAFTTFDPSKKDEFIKKNKIALQYADSLDLHGVTVNKDLIEFIKENCPSVKHIRLPRDTTNDDLTHISGLPNLTSLDLSECQKITDAGLKHLSSMKNLTSLDLRDCDQITDDGLGHLKDLPNLTSLDLSGCWKITDDGLGHISSMPNLTSLNLWVAGGSPMKALHCLIERSK